VKEPSDPVIPPSIIMVLTWKPEQYLQHLTFKPGLANEIWLPKNFVNPSLNQGVSISKGYFWQH
jgi:hypothetical protein